MKKRILIDATTVTSITDGLSQYIINLVKNFPEQTFQLFEISLPVNTGTESKELQELINSGKFKIVESNISPIGPKKDLGMSKFSKEHKNNFDFFPGTSNQDPLCMKSKIDTIYDISSKFYFDKPWWAFELA